ncbi:hypothetical protein D9M68_404920 [compost metagenome]
MTKELAYEHKRDGGGSVLVRPDFLGIANGRQALHGIAIARGRECVEDAPRLVIALEIHIGIAAQHHEVLAPARNLPELVEKRDRLAVTLRVEGRDCAIGQNGRLQLFNPPLALSRLGRGNRGLEVSAKAWATYQSTSTSEQLRRLDVLAATEITVSYCLSWEAFTNRARASATLSRSRKSDGGCRN